MQAGMKEDLNSRGRDGETHGGSGGDSDSRERQVTESDTESDSRDGVREQLTRAVIEEPQVRDLEYGTARRGNR